MAKGQMAKSDSRPAATRDRFASFHSVEGIVFEMP